MAALTWDAARLLLQAIQNTKGLSGRPGNKDRQAVRDQLAKIKEFDGITGKMTFDRENRRSATSAP